MVFFILMAFVESVPVETDIVAIDLFEMYKFRNSEKNKIEKKFKKNKNVTILQGDFYDTTTTTTTTTTTYYYNL